MNVPLEKKRGRPRSSSADAAIHEAVVSLLEEVGYGGLRMDDVADRAGVSKPTIYRRWSTKADLVVSALENLLAEEIPMPSTGSFDEDLRSIINSLYLLLGHTAMGRALPGLVADKAMDANLAVAIDRLWAQRQAKVAVVIRRGIESGQARSDVDVAVLIDMLAASAYYRLLVTGSPIDELSAKKHADALIAMTCLAQ